MKNNIIERIETKIEYRYVILLSKLNDIKNFIYEMYIDKNTWEQYLRLGLFDDDGEAKLTSIPMEWVKTFELKELEFELVIEYKYEIGYYSRMEEYEKNIKEFKKCMYDLNCIFKMWDYKENEETN